MTEIYSGTIRKYADISEERTDRAAKLFDEQKTREAVAADPKKRVVSEDEWNQTLANMGPDTAFTGTGTPRRQSRLRKAATGALQRVALFSIGGK